MSAISLTAAPTGQGKLPLNGDSLYEIINGQRVELPPMSIYAVWLASRLSYRLGPFVDEKNLGRVVTEGLFVLDAEIDLRRRPDVAFVSAEKWAVDRPLPETGDWEVAPNLAVEVISPTDIFREVIAKVTEYFAYGVAQVWVLLPNEREVYVYDSVTKVRILTDKDDLDGGSLIPGFRLALADLFQKEPALAPGRRLP